jgi:hypothetical protein
VGLGFWATERVREYRSIGDARGVSTSAVDRFLALPWRSRLRADTPMHMYPSGQYLSLVQVSWLGSALSKQPLTSCDTIVPLAQHDGKHLRGPSSKPVPEHRAAPPSRP